MKIDAKTLGMVLLCLFVLLTSVGTTLSLITIAHARKQIALLQSEHARDHRLIASAQSRQAGLHRDLITCADLQWLINQGVLAGYYIDGSYNLNSTPATLPSHCINR